ncbi:hypothetical protein LCGC14_1201250 [marine sediment metagenome]|uniref:Uncharacterized protein n=1 Tax=marine sediment metagenome TaxID=412755 RepID=A0A0F9M460_9ZZZZ
MNNEEVYEIQSPLSGRQTYHDAKMEVALDIVEGLRCGGCELVIVGEGIQCFCKDELIAVLASAHETSRWCSEDCLFENHEDPTLLPPGQGYPALLEEVPEEADPYCHAGKDGDCIWDGCPQEANNRKNYQSWCPLAKKEEDDV